MPTPIEDESSLQTTDLVRGESYLLRTATAQILTFACTHSSTERSPCVGTFTWSHGLVTTIVESAVLVEDPRPEYVAQACLPADAGLSIADLRIVSIAPLRPAPKRLTLDLVCPVGPIGTPAQRLRSTLDKNAKLVDELPPWARAAMGDGTAARFAQQPAQEKLSTVNRVDDWTAFADLRTQLARVLGCDPRASLRGIVDELSSRPTPAGEDVDEPASDPPMFADVDAELIDELYGEGTAAKALACLTEHVDVPELPGLRFPPDVDLSAVTQAQFDTAYAEAYGYLSEPYEPGVLLVEVKPSKAYCCEPGCEPGCEEPASVRIFDTRAEYDCAETHACNDHAVALGVSEDWAEWTSIPLDDHAFVWNVTRFDGPKSTSIEFDPDGPWLVIIQKLEGEEAGFVCVHPTPVFASLVRAYGRDGVARWAHTVDIKGAPEQTPAGADATPGNA